MKNQENLDFLKINSKNVQYNLQKLSHLVFEVTDRCNLNCKYCAYSELYRKYDTRECKNISFTRAKLVINYLFDLWKDDNFDGNNRELTISFYGGEPLMNISFIKKLIEYCESLELQKIGILCSYSMTSNAMLLDQYMDYCVEKKIRLLISLDGDKFAQSYRVDHSGNNSFDRVFSNIKLLQKKYPEFFANKIGFISVLHNRNEVESIYQFFRAEFDKIPIITPLNEVGICKEKKDDFIKMYKNPVESFYRSFNYKSIEYDFFTDAPRIAQLTNYILHESGNNFNSYNELYMNNDDFLMSTGTCMPFQVKMFVTVNGKILPCERISHNFSLGQVHETHVELNEEFIANKYNYYVSRHEKQCSKCASNRFCTHCVYQNDEIRNENTHCPVFCSENDIEKRNENIFMFLEDNPHYYRRILEEVKITI